MEANAGEIFSNTLASIAGYNHGQKCCEGSITLEITHLPLINVGFSKKQNGEFSSNIEYGGGGGGGRHKSIVFPK